MILKELSGNFPKLYHMAEDGSWPHILKRGLLSTSSLLTVYGYEGERRHKLESEWRSTKIKISCDGLEDAVLRDQIPMPPTALKQCLQNMTPEQWYTLINGRVFFWTTWKSLEMFLAAKEYKNHPQTVITLDTRKLLERYSEKITLSGINSGSTYFDPQKYTGPKPRGKSTFQLIEDYSLPYITELVVNGGVVDLESMTISAERWIAHRASYEAPIFEKLSNIWPEN